MIAARTHRVPGHRLDGGDRGPGRTSGARAPSKPRTPAYCPVTWFDGADDGLVPTALVAATVNRYGPVAGSVIV